MLRVRIPFPVPLRARRLIGQAGELKTHVDSGFESRRAYFSLDTDPVRYGRGLLNRWVAYAAEVRVLLCPPFYAGGK